MEYKLVDLAPEGWRTSLVVGVAVLVAIVGGLVRKLLPRRRVGERGGRYDAGSRLNGRMRRWMLGGREK